MSRLPSGGLIDRSQPLSFEFDGRAYSGFAGDTLASALVANNVQLVGRSFKYHRPRGILTAGSEEPNALVTLREGAFAEPNTRATTIELFDGLKAISQNRWPSLRFDALAINQLLGGLIGAGFYYKTFKWPASFWENVYEPLIRRAAGLGVLADQPDLDRYDRDHGFCDLLVIGGGPTGLAAAIEAGRAGLRTILVDEDSRLGGQLLSETCEIGGLSAVEWVERTAAELESMPHVRVLIRTSLFGVYDGEYTAVERVCDHLAIARPGQPRQRLWKIVARRAILATGAIERPIVFGGNDRPGVMMASAVSTWVRRYAAVPGRRAVVFTATDSGWKSALDLLAAGVDVAAVVDPRPSLPDMAGRLATAGVEVLGNAQIVGTSGVPVSRVHVRLRDGRVRTLRADLLAMSGGWNPAIGLGTHLGARLVWSDAVHGYLLPEDGLSRDLQPAGAAAGHFGAGAALRDGALRATEAIVALRGAARPTSTYATDDTPCEVGAFWYVERPRGKAFVDFQNDVTDSDVAQGAREGFVSVEHLKRYTTLGMGTDQGKGGQVNGHALLAAATGRAIAEVGTIRARPPYHPVAIGVLAGAHREAHFRPERRTAAHDWAQEQGATFVDVGQWKRAQWFARSSENDWRETVDREVRMTRQGVGICDVSTLGKIDVHGADAGLLLDRLYINTFSTLAIGKARYGVMLREDGFVMDDGTVTRLAQDSFYVTTTTANAARVMQHIDYARQVLWPEWDVQATSVTEQWSTYAIAGPQSRALLASAFPTLDVSAEALPFMGARRFIWNGVVCRVFRVSFSGELAFEVSAPAQMGEAMIRHLFASGAQFDVVPYGTEALGVMRIEMGHPAGNELNGQTTATDLGMGRMMSRKKDFIGRVMAQRLGLADRARPRLVGLMSRRDGDVLRGGAHLLRPGKPQVAAHDQGYVTSACWSPTLGRTIALALLVNGAERHGETIVVHDPVRGADVEAQVCHPVFHDPEGVRVRG
ncbi:sarcosine oxidase subunit alpha family protein [Novosphingobium sp. Rr 2-17]|uniref:sarcosine oxidase subunit alpha family protein n=1 Tax=Novosphingobium sp. Rr 2-17 TaxID=555793 RepID=UPI0002699862|nr:sarcosine oxidase subunit alpha family protein [Novosphingobium sp. Rr 2-17]EIZ79206.1 sarcosine oxidase subunit alpha family protein [Novosphingobium sp. Rr 2-17]